MLKQKEMIAMLLAGGQGSRLGVLTSSKAKPGVTFGGKYRIIDFPLSNCTNSGVDTVGVLTQYEPMELNRHIGIGIPWDLDRTEGGVALLSPYVSGKEGNWYSGTANAIYHNINYIDSYNPEYVLIISGDHIYKMDYSDMLNKHKENEADVTIAVLEVSMEEASRFGILNTGENGQVYEFEEKPENPKNNLASMGIYIFTWDKLRDALIKSNAVYDDTDFGMHVLPDMLQGGSKIFTHTFSDYWRDVGTIESYWQANMELTRVVPDFNLYDNSWKIYTKQEMQTPHYISEDAKICSSLVSDGCEIQGEITSSVLGTNVKVGKGSIIKDSIIMSGTVIGENCHIERCIIDERGVVGNNVRIGEGENIHNEIKPKIYNTGISVIGATAKIPDNVTIGKNCVVWEGFDGNVENNILQSGQTLVCSKGGLK